MSGLDVHPGVQMSVQLSDMDVESSDLIGPFDDPHPMPWRGISADPYGSMVSFLVIAFHWMTAMTPYQHGTASHRATAMLHD